jgi:tetratricopeptide (TPR) repeat protein
MDNKLKQAFEEEFLDYYKPDEMYVNKANQTDDKAKAIRYLRVALSINPDNQQAKQILLEIYPKAIHDVIDDGRYDNALALTEKALEVDGDNAKLLELQNQLMNDNQPDINSIPLISVKGLTFKFIKQYYPDEIPLFDITWETLKDFKGIRLKGGAFPGLTMAMTGDENETFITPVSILVFKHIAMHSDAEHPDDTMAQFSQIIKKISKYNHVDELFISNLMRFIKGYYGL